MSVSGRLSRCSVVLDENLARMDKIPATPMKTGHQITPRKSGSKRTLFQSFSPTESDDLGLMSPLSPTSDSSLNSIGSLPFSPSSKFSRTRLSCGDPLKRSLRKRSKEIKVISSLFPDLKVHTLRTLRSGKIVTSKLPVPQSSSSSCDELEEEPRSRPALGNTGRRLIFGEDSASGKSDSSSSIPDPSCSSEKDSSRKKSNDKPTKLGFKPLSCDSFYGPVPLPLKTKSFTGNMEPRSRGRELVRSLSRDSLSSNKSFVSGGTRKRTESNSSQRSRSKSSKGDRRKTPHPGVWHNIKRPKQMKKTKKPEKPLNSPQARMAQMVRALHSKEVKVKSKPFFQENPRKRVAHSKKREREDSGNGIIDPFPDHLIKRKKLPTAPVSAHPAISEPKAQSPEILEPDPNKKFMKYRQTRKVTFTLNDKVKLQISDGVMKLQSPKKRRKLYSGKKNVFEDFNDLDEGNNDVRQHIQGILNKLQSDESELQQTTNVEVEKICDSQPLEIRMKATPTKTGTKRQGSPLKTVSNLLAIVLNDFNTDYSDENSPCPSDPSLCKKSAWLDSSLSASDPHLLPTCGFPVSESNEVNTGETGNMVSCPTNNLMNDDQNAEMSLCQLVDDIENSPPGQGQYFSLFYKQNWDKNSALVKVATETQKKSKKVLVPDDQYLLDAGQKSIGIVTCKKCGVMYQAGDFADEATHISFHNHLPELRFSGWNNERVVGKFSDGRVIMILNTDPKVWWQKIMKIAEIVDQELGFPEATFRSLFYKTVYLYINEKSKQIAGCLIAEECKVAYRMLPPIEGVEIDHCSKDPSPCKVGISRIWTALSHRRKGVASRMVECLLKTFYFGNIVPLDQVAFSSPSPAGKLLAQKVTGRMDFLVYGFP